MTATAHGSSVAHENSGVLGPIAGQSGGDAINMTWKTGVDDPKAPPSIKIFWGRIIIPLRLLVSLTKDFLWHGI
jgi:hypothetical protein